MSYEIYRRFNIDIEVVDQFCFGGFEIEQEAIDFYNKHLKPGDMEPPHESAGVEYFLKHPKDKSYKLYLKN